MEQLPIILREKKMTLIIGVINIVIFTILLIGAAMVWFNEREQDMLMLAGAFLIFWCMGAYAVLEYFRHRIIIDEEKVKYISTLGLVKEIKIKDIGNITYPYSGLIKMCKIFDKAGKLIISFELIMMNSFEALEYLNKATGLNKIEEDEEATEE